MLFSSTCHNIEGIMTNNSNLVAGKRLQTLYTSSYMLAVIKYVKLQP